MRTEISQRRTSGDKGAVIQDVTMRERKVCMLRMRKDTFESRQTERQADFWHMPEQFLDRSRKNFGSFEFFFGTFEK